MVGWFRFMVGGGTGGRGSVGVSVSLVSPVVMLSSVGELSSDSSSYLGVIRLNWLRKVSSSGVETWKIKVSMRMDDFSSILVFCSKSFQAIAFQNMEYEPSSSAYQSTWYLTPSGPYQS